MCIIPGMKAGFACWQERIAPVFDVARQVRVVEATAGTIVADTPVTLPDNATQRVARLTELGVTTLLCGAISRPLEELVRAAGIRVVPFLAGEAAALIRAWQHGRLDRAAFAMPGCCGRRAGRRMRRGRCGAGRRRPEGMREA